MGKKKFIDKKKSATFQLIARDSSDPHYEEGPAGDRVFVRVDDNPYSNDSFFDEHNNAQGSNSIFDDAPEDYDDEDEGGDRNYNRQNQSPLPPRSGVQPLPDHIRREILELGFPDDGYNYLSHLREIKNTGGGSAYYHNSKANLEQLPNDVKAYDASRVEVLKVNDSLDEKVIYNVAAKTVVVRIQKAVDPEVAALLDDSDLSRFGSDVEDLEEDFVANANLSEKPSHVDFDVKLTLVDEIDMNKKESFEDNTFSSHENIVGYLGVGEDGNNTCNVGEGWVDEKPRVRRLLDDQFDMLELQEYGTDSEDEYSGDVAVENDHQEPIAEKLNEALRYHVKDDLQLDEAYKAPSDLLHDKNESAADVIHRCMEYAERYENENEDEDVVILQESSDESEIWDCETIVSTYSNLDNHPGKIGAPESRRKKKLPETVPSHVISLKGKDRLPVDFLPRSKKSDTEKSKEVSRLKTEPQKRKQHGQETKEEKKERKVAVKEERREARRVKKEMKELYKSEAQNAQKVAAFTGPSSIHLM